MKKLHLAFLWHMHQPYYKDDVKNVFYMPWVFLHAIKDYYELPWLQNHFPSIKATYNLVPSLLIQLSEYENIEVQDRFIQALRKDVVSLTNEDKKYLLENLFHANPHTMIKPLQRYHQIYLKRNRMSLEHQIEKFEEAEILDLEVLFLIAWCGNYLRENSIVVKTLLQKGSGFLHDEKIALLNELARFVGEIVPFYKKMCSSGQIEISTTPFYHPILPLLVDMENGVLANKHAKVPSIGRNLRGDADGHVRSAVEYFEQLFGFRPEGFWPAEGSVSAEALEILADNGIKWAATDEEIIFKTKKSGDRGLIYNKYRLHSYGRSIGLIFRDKALSDSIGFVYSRLSAKDAVNNFISKLKAIYDARDSSCVVPVILDGENAWENFHNNAKEFFIELYSRLEGLEWCECVRVCDVFENGHIKSEDLTHLEPGSWIGGDFHIWLGEPEENTAWSTLNSAREMLESKKDSVECTLYEKAKKELFIAQGSDWFWWYGDDHYTPLKDEFDFIFRTHLINIYELLGESVPENLYRPISRLSQREIKKRLPQNEIAPVIDGEESSFFEWSGAGFVELSSKFGAMSTSAGLFKGVYYGFDDEYLYCRLDAELKEYLDSNHELGVEFKNPREKLLRFPLKLGHFKKNGAESCIGTFCEFKIKKSLFWDGKASSVELNFLVLQNSIRMESAPLNGVASLEMVQNYTNEWFV